ncbi:MAG: hypothetical protein ACJ0UT_00700 [Candidatus Latescibacterota bacterium]
MQGRGKGLTVSVEVDGCQAGVVELDKLVFVGVAVSVPIGVAAHTWGRIGEHFVNKYLRPRS